MSAKERAHDISRHKRRWAFMDESTYRAWARKDKRLERMRRAHRAGRPYTVTEASGPDEARHPQDCLCYDCQFGWVRELRLQAATHNVALLDEGPPARTGRGNHRASKMPGVAHVSC